MACLAAGLLCLIASFPERNTFALEGQQGVREEGFWEAERTDLSTDTSPDQRKSGGTAEEVEAQEEPPPRPESRETFFSTDYVKLLFSDTKHVLTAPVRWDKKDWATFSLALGAVGAAALLDKPVWDLMRHNQSKTGLHIADGLADAGGISSLSLIVPFYLGGEVFDSPKAKSVALDIVPASLIAAGIIAPTLKFVFGRSAPREDKGTYDFHPFTYHFQLSSGPQSFPSGHAAQGFSIASVIAAHYDETWIKVTAYSLASITSLCRLYQGVHFLSDSVAGMLIGTAVGHSVVYFNEKRRKEKRESRVLILPFLTPGGFGLMAGFRYD